MKNRRFYVVSLIVLAVSLVALAMYGGNGNDDDAGAASTPVPVDNGLRISQ